MSCVVLSVAFGVCVCSALADCRCAAPLVLSPRLDGLTLIFCSSCIVVCGDWRRRDLRIRIDVAVMRNEEVDPVRVLYRRWVALIAEPMPP